MVLLLRYREAHLPKSGQKMGRGNFEDFYFIITPNSTLEQSWSLARFSPNLKISVH